MPLNNDMLSEINMDTIDEFVSTDNYKAETHIISVQTFTMIMEDIEKMFPSSPIEFKEDLLKLLLSHCNPQVPFRDTFELDEFHDILQIHLNDYSIECTSKTFFELVECMDFMYEILSGMFGLEMEFYITYQNVEDFPKNKMIVFKHIEIYTMMFDIHYVVLTKEK